MVEQAFRVRKGLTVANTTASANLDPVTLTVGTTIVNSTAIATGANVLLSVSDFKIGFGTANLHANSILVKIANTIGTANLQPTQLVIGTSVVNTTAVGVEKVVVSGNVTLSGGIIANGSIGTVNQLLTSNASGSYWADAPAGVTYASDAQVQAATSGSLAIKASALETASADVTLTDAATIAIDWDIGVNFIVTLTTSRILGNPTNGQAGTWRTILVTQPAGGTAVLTFGNQYVFVGGTVPIIGTGNAAKSRLSIYCRSSTVFECYMAGAGLA